LLFSQADIGQPVVAHQRRTMTIQAMINEQLSAVLECGLVVELLGRESVEWNPPARCMGREANRRGQTKHRKQGCRERCRSCHQLCNALANELANELRNELNNRWGGEAGRALRSSN